MLRTPPPQTFPPETHSLDERVSKNHLVRQVDAALDFEFIRELVAPLYCHNNGRPAIDPVMLIKMMLLGYLFGIPSERRLVQEIQVNVAYRWFLRLGLTGNSPKYQEDSVASRHVLLFLLLDTGGIWYGKDKNGASVGDPMELMRKMATTFFIMKKQTPFF